MNFLEIFVKISGNVEECNINGMVKPKRRAKQTNKKCNYLEHDSSLFRQENVIYNEFRKIDDLETYFYVCEIRNSLKTFQTNTFCYQRLQKHGSVRAGYKLEQPRKAKQIEKLTYIMCLSVAKQLLKRVGKGMRQYFSLLGETFKEKRLQNEAPVKNSMLYIAPVLI